MEQPPDDERHRILPTNDLLFRKLMTSRRHLTIIQGFIWVFFGLNVAVEDIQITNPYLIDLFTQTNLDGQEINHLRQLIPDVVLSVPQADLLIEMQLDMTSDFIRRATAYLAGKYYGGYGRNPQNLHLTDSLKPSWQMSVTKQALFPEDTLCYRFETLLTPCHQEPVPLLRQGFFELSKEPDTPDRQYWQQFLLTGRAPDGAPDYLCDAEAIVDNTNLTSVEREMITLQQKQQDYFNARLADGIALGKREAEIETAKRALDLGMAPAQVAAITGLSLDEVIELKCGISRAH